MTSLTDKIAQLRKALDDADAVLIGAGAGLSAAAGLIMIGRASLRISRISSPNMASPIFTAPASTSSTASKKNGPSGAVTSCSIATVTSRTPPTTC